MGNYKFRLSDMIPNAWFYKLKDMSRSRNSHPTKKKQSSSTNASQKPPLSQPRQSFYYSWESTRTDQKLQNSPIYSKASSNLYYPDPPRRSSKRRSRRKTVYKPSPRRAVASFVPADCRCHSSFTPPQDYFDSSTDASLELDLLKSPSSEFESDTFDAPGVASRSSTCSCGFSSSATDIIIDVNEKSFTRNFDKLDAFDTIPELDLPPILTKPSKFNDAPAKLEGAKLCDSPQLEDIQALGNSLSIKIVKEERAKTRKEITTSPGSRKSVSHSTGIKLRANSPKLASKKVQCQGRKSISKRTKPQKKAFSESFAVVKSSFDPQRDFRDSMMEMIVENNIRASKDLEELLACYLSLNSDEYHELIIKAFEQIWFNMPELQL